MSRDPRRAELRRLLPAACLAAIAAVQACDQSRTVGSRWVASQQISAAAGGTIAVPQGSGDPLSGAALTLDPNAIAADAFITLEETAAPLGTIPRGAGPAASWGPAGLTLQHPAVMTLPYALGTGQSAADLVVFETAAGGQISRIEHARLTVDTANGLVRFPVEHLGAFQAAALVRCATATECGGDLICRSGECHTADAGPTTCSTIGCICNLQISCLTPLVCREGLCREPLHDGGDP